MVGQKLILELICVRCLDGNICYIISYNVCVHRSSDVHMLEVVLLGFVTQHLLLAPHCHHLFDHEAVLVDVPVSAIQPAGWDEST